MSDERRLVLFPAATIVRDPHHCESPTCLEQDLNLCRTWIQDFLNKFSISDNQYTSSPQSSCLFSEAKSDLKLTRLKEGDKSLFLFLYLFFERGIFFVLHESLDSFQRFCKGSSSLPDQTNARFFELIGCS